MAPTPGTAHAVVIGGSIAGLVAARVAAEHFERVTILERRDQPADGDSITAQGRMVHVLLAAGANSLDDLFPGFLDELRGHGAVEGTMQKAIWWSEGYRVPPDVGITVHLASRGLVESLVRRRVAAIPAVTMRHGSGVTGLPTSDASVVGVQADGGAIPADLVIDCSGRTSKAPRWLADAGLPSPAGEEVGVDVWYTQTMLDDQPGLSPGVDFYAAQPNRDIPRGGIAERVEGGRWVVALSSYFGVRPPRGPEGFLAFADSLASPDIAALLRRAGGIGRTVAYGFKSSHRWHYESTHPPAGFLPLGDSLGSVNPIYGQGMSVAVLEACALGSLLHRHGNSPELPRQATRAFSRILDSAWQLAVTADLAYPATTGRRTRITQISNAYSERLLRASTVDPVVGGAMFEVQNMLAPSAHLLRPHVVARTVRAQRRWRHARASAAHPGPAPA